MDWLLSGATRQELALIAFIAVLILVANRVPRLGGAVGAWIERRKNGGGASNRSDTGEPSE